MQVVSSKKQPEKKKPIKVPPEIEKRYRPLYKKIVEHLQASNLFLDVDEQLVVNAVNLQQIVDEARAEVRASGLLLDSEHGVKQNPAVQVLNQTQGSLIRIYAAIGLGAAARRKLVVDTPQKAPDNPWQRA